MQAAHGASMRPRHKAAENVRVDLITAELGLELQ